MRGISSMSLDAWLFGEDDAPPTSQRKTPPRQQGVGSASKRKSGGGSRGKAAPALEPSVLRSNSLPVNSLSDRVAARAKKTSLALAINTAAAAAVPTPSTKTPPPRPATPGHGDLFPASSKLRKLFRPNRLQWNRGRQSLAATPEEKQRQLLGLSSESFQRLQGHVPFTLKEIVKDPKKLPYLLRWLSSDDDEATLASPRTNYHQVLLFLLEIEQLQLVIEEKRKEQAVKIWNKYIDHASEFQISTTLELTHELEQLVHENIRREDKVLDGFFPIQKLAYMRLTREEMPLFLKSPEYLQMLIDTENDTESVPMERILQQPRAAHYFLLFLMQSRQHFELYFWLHVEYVLKPLLESRRLDLFWKLGRVLIRKAQNDSQAITVTTKTDLHAAIDQRGMDEKLQPSQPTAKALFVRAQQEIFVMLRSSWYNRFMKSNLYKVALKDCQIHVDASEAKEDSPPKLLSRTFSSLEYTTASDDATDETGDTVDGTVADDKHDEVREEQAHHHSPISLDPSIPSQLPSDESNSSSNESESDSDSSGEEAMIDFSKMELNLESIIRLTKLPDGLQVHYRPHYDATATSLAAATATEPDATVEATSDAEHRFAIETVLTFATFVEQQGHTETKATLMLMPIAAPHTRSDAPSTADFAETSKRVKTFLVPDGRLVITQPVDEPPPPSILFPYQQSGRDGFLYGCVYLTYESLGSSSATPGQRVYASKGICILSRFPLVEALRRALETHVVCHLEPLRSDGLFDPDALARLYESDALSQSTALVSQLPADALRRCTRSESGSALHRALLDTRVDVSVLPLFEQFGTATALQILACALLECSVVFVSSEYSLLTTCAEAVRCLLRPFSWCHVYSPVLPAPLLSYLQCPTPILVGLHSAYADRGDLPHAGFYAVADMDRGVLEFMDDRHAVSWRRLGLQASGSGAADSRVFLPSVFEAAKARLDRILWPAKRGYDRVGGRASPAATATASREEAVRVACVELLSSLVDGHTEACLVVGDAKESVVIFDETQFLASRIAAEDHAFYHALFRAQCFSELVSAHRIDVTAEAGSSELAQVR